MQHYRKENDGMLQEPTTLQKCMNLVIRQLKYMRF